MAVEIMAVKMPDGTIEGATDADKQEIAKLTAGKAFKLKITSVSNRSYQHHKLFFGGLIPFAYQYWDSGSGMISNAERSIVSKFIKTMEANSGRELPVVRDMAEEFFSALDAQRTKKFGGVNRGLKEFRDWLVIESGFYEVVQTPNGLRKVPKSLNYLHTSQEEFNEIYKKCFDTAWNMLLKHKFKTEEEAEEAIRELMLMG